MNDIVPSRTLARQGVAAVAGIGGGLALLILNAIPVVNIVAGGAIALLGFGALSSHAPEDKRGGAVAAAAGGLTVLSHLDKVPLIGAFSGLAASLVNLGIVGLLGMGAWSAYKFIKGLKTRA
jgi:hypothetical protein